MSQNKTQNRPQETQRRIEYIYNPDNQTREELIDNFIIRNREFKKIFNEINSTALDEAPQHFLIEGQRGSGKTSLMLRIRYEIENEIENNNSTNTLLPVQLPEEQYGVFDLCRLWENIADYLHDEPGFEILAEELDQQAEQQDYPTVCFDLLDEFLVKNHKRLVLFLDNFGDMLDRFGDLELKRLRDIFHTSKHIQLIAASAQTLEYTYKHDQPFYEFFKIIRLKNLSNKEASSLLRQLAIRYDTEEEINRIIEKQPERIETIRLLTGGVPRTIVLLFEIFLDKNGNVFEDLESLLDRVTPLYKHRMDDLKRNQQAIMDVIALNWDGIGTAEIVARLKGRGFNNKKVAAQLKALEQNDLVSSKLVDKKNKIYFIRERFFNIWYLMRLGRRKNGERVRWLVQFLKAWYAPHDLAQRVRDHIEKVQQGQLHPKGARYLGEAMAQLVPDINLQDELLTATRRFIGLHNKQLANKLSPSDKTLFEKSSKAYLNKAYKESLRQVKELSKSYNGRKKYLIALIYQKLKDFDKAIQYYQLSIDEGHADAMVNLGLLYETEFKDFDKAIANYLLAIDKGDACAMFNLAVLYKMEFKDFDKAIQYYQLAIDKGHSNAIINLGNLYLAELKDFDKAIQYYQLAIDKGHVRAMNNLAWLYFEQQMTDKIKLAIELAEKSVSIEPHYNSLDTLAKVLLWDNQYKASDKTIRALFKDHNYQWGLSSIADYFIFLIARKQLQSAYSLFQDFPQLQDEIKPVYYALMTLLKDQFPKEYLKMGDELESTVEQILEKVEKMRDKYTDTDKK